MIPLPGRRRIPRRPEGDRGLIEVRRCNQAEALVLKSLFESEGIPTLLRSHLLSSLHPFSVGAQGQVAVLVPAGDVSRCRPLMIRGLRKIAGEPMRQAHRAHPPARPGPPSIAPETT
jgi:hypothetical protein